MSSQTNKRPVKKSKAEPSGRPDPTTRILENVELLVALQETQENVDSDANGIVQAVESKFGERFDNLDRRVSDIAEMVGKLQERPPESAEKSNGQDLEAMLELFSDHFDAKTDQIMESAGQLASQKHDFEENIQQVTGHFDEKTQDFVRTIQLQLDEQLEQRFEKLNAHVDKITSALAGQQALLESGNAPASDSGPSILDQFDKRIEGVFLSFNARIDDLFGSLGNRISQLAENNARQESNLEVPVAVEEDENTASHWHRQKEAMLSKYGIDPDYRPLMDNKPDESNKAQESELEEATENLESLHNSIDSISAADAEAIDNLKEELTSKLRDAEVEFSINRAKLSQLKAELDDRQVELERRASTLEEKYGGSNSLARKSGFLDRLTRHLSLRKSEPLGD